MTRVRLVAAAALVALCVFAGLAIGAGGDGDGNGRYLVRAVFDNSSFVIPGEDVKVAGVKVGKIDSLDLTKDNKAVVVLDITDPAFQSFKTDARCRIALQSLIGEQFVDCVATAGGNDGRAKALPAIEDGPGKGQHLLSVSHNTTPVGVDLLNNIMRQPQRDRFKLIINELGAGLAANGDSLREAVRRANPALQQLDNVVVILARQDQMLGKLVDDSDTVLAPLAEHRKDLGGFVDTAGKTAVATAEQGDAFEQDLAKLPAFLQQLKPAAQRFGALADQMGPAVATLSAQAPAVNQAIKDLGPFSLSARPALKTLGDVADRGRRTFPKIGGLVDSLGSLSQPLQPLAADLANVSGSFDSAGGFESLMRFIFNYTGSVNGEDAQGHFIRSTVDVTNCVQRSTTSPGSCPWTFEKPGDADAAAASKASTSKATATTATATKATATKATTADTQAAATLLDYLLGQDGGK
jgi:ABC-type transporter Mla subunit MlaD